MENAENTIVNNNSEIAELQQIAAELETGTVQSNAAKSKIVTVTEIIQGGKSVTRKDSNQEMIIVVTVTGQQVWVPKEQFNPDAETITYRKIPKGQVWFTDQSTGQPVIATADRTDFLALGKQQVKKFTSEQDKLEFLVKLGAKFSI